MSVPVILCPMKKALPKRIAVFLSLDQDIFKGYYNPQDPAPLYKRQLSHDFEEYIMLSIRAAKRDSPFHYKISYRNECEKQYAEPLYSCNVKIYEHSPHRHPRSQVPKGHHHSSTNYTLPL